MSKFEKGRILYGKNNSNWKGGQISKICLICEKPYTVKISSAKSKYCSLQCVGESQKGVQKTETTKVLKSCEICKSDFLVFKAHMNRQFCCSKECGNTRRSFFSSGESNPAWKGGISRLPYPYDWSKISLKIRTRDGHKCMNPTCTGKGKIEAHHIDYDKMNVSDNNLIALCTSCNSKANFNRHKWFKYYKDIVFKIILT